MKPRVNYDALPNSDPTLNAIPTFGSFRKYTCGV
jgi:hypothetical protein